MDRTSAIVLSVVFGGLFLALFGFLFLAYTAMEGFDGGSRLSLGTSIGVVPIEGEIADSQETLKALNEFANDDRVKALVIRIDSPGGAVAPSQEIYRELLRVGEEKPIVCSLGNMAASGGYYIAAGCTHIVANPGTLTGSIGVIAQLPFLGDVAEALKFKMLTIKSGALKDVGNPFRPMADEERAFFQAMLDSVHEQFIRAVADGRELELDVVRPIADGRVLTGEQAFGLGLVDELGNFNDAVLAATAMAGLQDVPKLRYPAKANRFQFESWLQEGGKALARGIRSELMAPDVLGPTLTPMAR